MLLGGKGSRFKYWETWLPKNVSRHPGGYEPASWVGEHPIYIYIINMWIHIYTNNILDMYICTKKTYNNNIYMYIYKCILYICRLFMYTFVVHIQFFRLAYRALSIPTGNIAIFLNLQQFVYKNVIAHPNGTREDLWIFIKIWKQEWLILGALNNEASKNRSHQNYCFLLLFFSGATVYQVVQPQQMFKKKRSKI